MSFGDGFPQTAGGLYVPPSFDDGSLGDLAYVNYEDLIGSLQKDLQLNLSTDVQPNTFPVVSGLVKWIAAPLLNSWVNYGAPYETAGYLKDPLGFVHLKGLVKTGTNATVALALPVGFRPGADCQFVTTGPGPSFSIVDVQSNTGNVTLFNTNTNGVGLSGVIFLAEN